MNTTKVIKKVKKTLPGKSFKLIDFLAKDVLVDSKKNNVVGDGDGGDENSDDEHPPQPTTSTSMNYYFMIHMFAINEKGESCCIIVDDFQPFFYLRVGSNWTKENADLLFMEICSKLPFFFKKNVLNIELVEKQKLYGFTAGNKDQFVKLTFSNVMTMNRVKNLFYTYIHEKRVFTPLRSQGCILELYESSIPPLLRYFHICNVSPSGWVFIPFSHATIPSKLQTTCTYEYICQSTHITPQPHKETMVPYKICSFDIEASSSHGDFPVPIKTYKKLATNIVDIHSNQKKVSNVDIEKCKSLLSKIIFCSFGFSTYPNVDLVFPITPPTQEELKKYIQYLFNYFIEEIGGASHHLLTIESVFEKAKETFHHNNNENDDDANDDDDYLEENNDDVDHDDWGGANPATSLPRPRPPPPQTHKTHKTKIFDLLNNDKLKRDEKIQKINEIMMCIFPKLQGDKVTFIGSTFLKYGEALPYLNHCLVLNTCNTIPNVEIETVENEKDLLIKWTELIQQENPDIIIGYNIFRFDYEFMFRRAQENNCEKEFLLLSRFKNFISANVDKTTNEISLENTKLVISTGEYDLYYPKMIGRLQIDMYTYIKREYNLTSYKLDDVAGKFIGDDIKFFETSENETKLCTNNITGLQIGDYIHVEIQGFTCDYFDNGKKFHVKDILKNVEKMDPKTNKTITCNVICIDLDERMLNLKNSKWCISKDDVSPQDIFRLTNGTSTDRAIIAKYCVQDCNLVHHLMNKIDVITGYIEMSRICSVPIEYLVFRGQGIKLTSFVAKKCMEKNTLMPDLEKKWGGENNEGYEGAIVLPPKCNIYIDNPVACVDYASLYPSSMISQNISHDSKVWTKEYDLNGHLISETGVKNKRGEYIYDNLKDHEYINIEFDTFKYIKKAPTSKAVKTKTGTKICRWVQLPNNQKSIMPSISEELLKARADTRKLMKLEKDPFMQNILDKRQLGYKVTANSLYGQCGAKTSSFHEKDVASSITATGRMMITYAKRIIEEVYTNRVYDTVCHGPVSINAEYVYGDTDSVFFTFNLKNVETQEKVVGKKALEMTIEIAQDVAKLCTRFLKPPMELAYEKTLEPFILLAKKRYVGILYETDINKGKLKFMGLSLKRLDSCDYLKDVYGRTLDILLKENDIQKAVAFLEESLVHLIKGNVSMDKLTITKALSGYYKNPLQIAHCVLSERIGKRDPGNKPKPGDRIKFVHIVNNTKGALQGEKIETPEYIVQNKLKIDYTFYITNQLMKPLCQLFGLVLEGIWKYQKKYSAIHLFKKDLEKINSSSIHFEDYIKKKEKYCSSKVKVLLFDKHLNQIYNDENKIQCITNFFGKQG